MLDFIFVSLIFFEIALTFFCVAKLRQFEARVEELNKRMVFYTVVVIEANKSFIKTIHQVNKVVSFITDKKIIQIGKIIKILVNIIQIVLLFRTLNLSKGFKSINFGIIKSMIYAQTIKSAILGLAKLLCRV